MSKSGNPNGAPGASDMSDTFDFVKNMWGGMKMPGMVMPTMSVDEINKQIADLKAVESWLTLNMNMLRGTIQALEVQSATLATLQEMSANMSSMMQANTGQTPEKTDFVSPFSSSSPAAENTPGPGADPKSPQSRQAGDTAGTNPPFANPAIWWNMLQQQFNQAVNAATAPEPKSPAAKTAPSSRRKSPKS